MARINPSSPRGQLLAAQSEKAFQNHVVSFAKERGWRVFHDYDSRRNPSGFPDLVMMHPTQNRVIFAELKSQKGYTRPKQRDWIDGLGMVPMVEVYLWRPLDIDNVELILKGEYENGSGYLGRICPVIHDQDVPEDTCCIREL